MQLQLCHNICGATDSAHHMGWANSACVVSARSPVTQARASEATCSLRRKVGAEPDRAAREAVCPGEASTAPTAQGQPVPGLWTDGVGVGSSETQPVSLSHPLL